MTRIVPQNAITIPAHAKRVFTGVIFDVYQWPQQLYDGSEAIFEMLKRPDTVTFVCIKDGKLVFITDEQPNRKAVTRLPGGRVDTGESWLAAAQRECSEELGMAFRNWRLIAVRQPVAKIEWFVATYVATDLLDEHAPHADPGEKIVPHGFTLEEAKAAVADAPSSLNDFVGELLASVGSVEELANLPEFTGKEISDGSRETHD